MTNFLDARDRRWCVVATALWCCLAGASRGESGLGFGSGAQGVTLGRGDRSGYTLFEPTPRELMREMSTDRPDTTESAYSVDAGHFQIELSFVDFSYDGADEGEATARTIAVAPMLLKAGLTNNIDLQLGLDPYTRDRSTGATANERTGVEGFGDMLIRLKVNLWGNDGGRTALAVMPFITLPTASNGLGSEGFEGGLIVPLAIALAHELSLGLMAEIDFNRNGADDGYVVDFVHTATISRKLFGDLSAYIEYAGFADLSSEVDYRGYCNAGLTYGLTADTQLDAGLRAGLTEAADDFGVFAGISLRF